MEKEYTDNEKIIALYKYIKEFWASRQKSIVNDDDYEWKYLVDNIPEDKENIEFFYQDDFEEEIEDNANINNVILRVHKPEFERCPEPSDELLKWIDDDWKDYRKDITPKDFIIENENREEFVSDSNRVNTYNAWAEERANWKSRQLLIEQTRKFFTDLYTKYIDLQRDSEIKELIVSNGYIKDNSNSKINHGVLTKRLTIKFDATDNTIYILDTNSKPELYTDIFHYMEDINIDLLSEIQDDLDQNEYHPLDRNNTKDFLKVFIHKLSSDSKYIETMADLENDHSRFQMFYKPTFIFRKRIDGTGKALDQIIKNIENGGFIPQHLIDIVSGGIIETVETPDETIEETLARAGGESVDVLLSKEANSEQLEIAKKIEQHNAVIVQGPPGTGKTHTISNLIGHFLAQGKSVLVTSQTPKALSVLKDKIPGSLQNLCVSLLKDTNEDMEKSVAGITEYMGKTNSYELEKQKESLKVQRQELIKELSQVRKTIFNTLNQEYKSITFNGEDINPIDAAKFVFQNKETLSYIDDTDIEINTSIPLSKDELSFLYNSNKSLSDDDIKELKIDLPDPSSLIAPEDLKNEINKLNENKNNIKNIEETNNWKINIDAKTIRISFDNRDIAINNLTEERLNIIQKFINNTQSFDKWMIVACVDGKRKQSYKSRWETLIEEIKKAKEIREELLKDSFGKEIQINENNYYDYLREMEMLKDIFVKKGKISKTTLFIHTKLKEIYEKISIDGKPISSKEDCDIIINQIKLHNLNNKISNMWNELMSTNGVEKYYDLDPNEPELIASKWIDKIEDCLNWYDLEYFNVVKCINEMGANISDVFGYSNLENDANQIEKITNSTHEELPIIYKICKCALNIFNIEDNIARNIEILSESALSNSNICKSAYESLINKDVEKYTSEFISLKNTFDKINTNSRRSELLTKLRNVAPGWARDIENKTGIHGQDICPENIQDAWKWIQYKKILENNNKKSLIDLQEESQDLSKRYRDITRRYAEKCAWYNLLKRTENNISLKQDLIGWEQTIKKIGKATGKHAPKFKAKARELMGKCQKAVPCWIMPFSKAIESLKPGENIFDVIIIDEASQSDITALSIAYMAKKMIVVGDDKQVSPMAVGVELDKVNALQEVHIKGKIPNSHLYTTKTSLYDIASTTFQPLMLKEHFRCVPQIIGYSNMLSYDYKIKPLRDPASSLLIPAVVNYRVDGKRTGKTNEVEAYTILALLSACIENEKYDGKTFGIISLLGDEQVKLIQQLVFKHIDPIIIESRKILVGNASNFQGDERDVIFLSMVDSRTDSGPLPLQGNGVEDSIKKRYNVAVSRAKDQIWCINSLDAGSDLKPQDIRKQLLDYFTDPNAFENKLGEIEKESESPFEEEVAKRLLSKGYHIKQQYPAGAYRLDIVVICEGRKIVIECDGEKFHSGEDKIREDMQRQTILERIGWKFIRIRGSQFFSDPDETMQDVYKKLEEMDIYPESVELESENNSSELLEDIKNNANNKLATIYNLKDKGIDSEESILFALNNNDILKKELHSENIKKNTANLNIQQKTEKEHPNNTFLMRERIGYKKENPMNNMTFDDIDMNEKEISRKSDSLNEIPQIKELISILDKEEDYSKRKELMEKIKKIKDSIRNVKQEDTISSNPVNTDIPSNNNNVEKYNLEDKVEKYLNDVIKDDDTMKIMKDVIDDYNINTIQDLYKWDYKYLLKYNLNPNNARIISSFLSSINYTYINDFINPIEDNKYLEKISAESQYFYKLLIEFNVTNSNIKEFNFLKLLTDKNKLFVLKGYIEKYFKIGYEL